MVSVRQSVGLSSSTGAQRINEKHNSWVLPVILVNNCLGVKFDDPV